MQWYEKMIKKTFLGQTNPLLTVILQCETPEVAIGRIRNANFLGADAYGLQVESLKREYQNPDIYKKIFSEMKGRPSYVTYYRGKSNAGRSDDELAEGILELADSGATLCDVMGDMFCKHDEELTPDPDAIKKQMKLIDQLHCKGAEVLMSSHLYKYAPAERVLEIAMEQKKRGADIIKIVTKANNMAEQIENLRITNLLNEELDAPFLFLSGGVCTLHRRLGMHLGCCMSLCVYEHDALSTASQPLLQTMKKIKDEIDF